MSIRKIYITLTFLITSIVSYAGIEKRCYFEVNKSPTYSYIKAVALVGGGINPQPGEISLAQNGVLFADQLPELNKQTLEVLRQPLEDHKITISRSKNTSRFSTTFCCPLKSPNRSGRRAFSKSFSPLRPCS